MYAVVKAGGRQYRLTVGDTVKVDRRTEEPGQEVVLDQVLLVGGTDDEVKVGNPAVTGVTVRARVLEHGRGPKILVFKYKPKVNYRKRQGHRQDYTALKVLAIEGVPGGQE